VTRLSPAINPTIVRSYDLRGAVGRELNLGDAHALGLAYATFARTQGKRRIAVGRDGRLSSSSLEHALINGLVEGGMHISQLGLGPTPQLYFAVQSLDFDGGIMVTGSHNPPHENGFKLLLDGDPVYGARLRSLVATDCVPASGGRSSELRVSDDYVERLARETRDCRPLKIVWDSGNGAVGALIEKLTRRVPGRHVLLNERVDGSFPAHHPDPAVAENLRELQKDVVEHDADLGIAFDGDGDRIGVVDETGTVLWPDQLLLFLAADVLAAHPHAPIVADVKSSRVLFDGITRLGGHAVMAPSGYVLVRARMLREHAPLAGEMSGHIMFADTWYGADDALYVAMRTLAALSHREESLADFRKGLPVTATTPEIRLPCPEERKADVVREVAARLSRTAAAVDTTDGLRVTTDEGWWLLRASGTEPKLTVRCEAADEAGLAHLCRELTAQLRQSGVCSAIEPVFD
jgi:phosphomannomutase